MTSPSRQDAAAAGAVACELVARDWRHPGAGLANLSDRSVGFLCTDPPFRPRVHEGQVRQTRHKKAGEAGVEVHEVEYSALTDDLREASAAEFARLATRWVAVHCDVEGAEDWRRSLARAGLEYIRTVPWIKRAAMPQMSGDRPAPAMEAIVLAHVVGAPKRWAGGGRALWYYETPHRDAEITGQKPLSLMLRVVSDFSEPGELVVDPFAGMATTLLAARTLGRPSLGYEVNPVTARKARARLARTLKTPEQE